MKSADGNEYGGLMLIVKDYTIFAEASSSSSAFQR
jgi:hypothetical protein